MVTALYILLAIAFISAFLYIRYRIFLVRVEEVVVWYSRVDPDEVFYIPRRISVLRRNIGERAFKLTLRSVDKKRYNL